MDTRNTPLEHDAGYRAGTVQPLGGSTFFKRISWGAIFAGTLIILVTMMLLNLLGIGIGLGTIDPTQEQRPFSGLGIGTIIWWVVSNLIAIFAGAFIAGKLAGIPMRSTGIIHGILSWCLYTIVSFWILTSAVGSLLSGVGSVISGTLSAAGSGVQALADSGQQNNGQERSGLIVAIENEVRAALDPARDSKLVPDSAENIAERTARDVRQNVSRQQIESIVNDVFFKDGTIDQNITRDQVVTAIQRHTTLNRQEVNEMADTMYRKYEQAKAELQQFVQRAEQQARETGEEVAEAASGAAIWSFVALLLGAIAAAAGGGVATPETIPAVGTDARIRDR